MTDAVNSLANLSNSEKDIPKELFAARVKRDHNDYTKLKLWYEEYNPFEAEEGLVAIDTGLTNVEGKIRSYRAEDIDTLFQN